MSGVNNVLAEVFARGHTLKDVAAEWLKSFEQHESEAVAGLVNFVIKASGCDLKVTDVDIEDPDHCTSRIEDIQGEYQAVSTPRPLARHQADRSTSTTFPNTQ